MRAPPVLLILLLCLVVLAGCEPGMLDALTPYNPPHPPLCDELTQEEVQAQNIPFETVSLTTSTGYAEIWPDDKPALRIITTSEDIVPIEPYLTQADREAMRDVDYTSSLVAATFDSEAYGGWQFCITSITRQGNQVVFHIHLIESPVAPTVVSGYYHLIRLARSSLSEEGMTFALALTRHEYITPTGGRRVLPRSDEEVVDTVSLPTP
ncbi:MAG: hypothetical protein R2873_04975 [Caldilineaceae bacterium]